MPTPLSWSFLPPPAPPAPSAAGASPTAPAVSITDTADYAAALDYLRDDLSPALVGDNWDAFLAAVAVGEAYNKQNARLAFDQIFRSTASGQYLNKRMEDYGIERPTSIGMGDELFRELGLALSNDALTNQALWKVLEIYYGADAVRANLTSGMPQPYSIADGDTLRILVDERTLVTVPFAISDFQNNTQAGALEVAAVINRAFQAEGVTAYAIAFLNPTDGLMYVRLYSGALGMVGALRVQGGRVQNVLSFPATITSGAANTQWTVTFTPGTNVVRMTFSGGGDPGLDNVRVGDYVNVYGSTFHSVNRGTFTVTKIFVDSSTSPRTEWVEFQNPLGATETVIQIFTADVVFYRALRSAGIAARVTTANPNEISVVLPATTQAVNRKIGTGAYLHASPISNISALTRDTTGLVTVTTSAPHGLATGSWAFIDGAYPIPTNSPDTWGTVNSMAQARQRQSVTVLNNAQILVAGGLDQNGAALSSVEKYDPATRTWSAATPMLSPRYDHRATLLSDGRVLVTGGTGSGTTVYAVAEIYDPRTGLWAAAGSMATARTAHVSVLLNTGFVLVAGGNSVASYDLFNPSSGTWTSGTMTDSSGAVAVGGNPFERPAAGGANDFVIGKYARAVLLANGHAFVCGGDGYRQSFIFAPETVTWTAQAFMAFGRQQHSATLLSDGRVLVAGGSDITGATPIAKVEIFDPVNTWTTKADMATARHGHGAALLGTGEVLVAGGFTTGTPVVPTSTVEKYNVGSNTWSALSALSQSRAIFGGIASLPNFKMEVVGGQGAASSTLTGAESYPKEATGGGLNGAFAVTVLTSTQFTYQTPSFPFVSTCAEGSVLPMAAPAGGAQRGPYTFDPVNGLAITSVRTTVQSAVAAGHQQTILAVQDTSNFPDEAGWLVFGFGTDAQQGPVGYAGKISGTQLLLDGSYIFQEDVAVGSDVTLLLQKGAWVPGDVATVGAFYITASPAGRVAASDTLDEVIAAGFDVEKTVVYPGDRGLGGEGWGATGQKLSDAVSVWAGDDVDAEVAAAQAQ